MTSASASAASRSDTYTAEGPGSWSGGRRGNPALTLLTVALGVMMVALDGTIVAVANPAIQANLHASLADIQWVTNAYLLALAVSLIAIGKFGDRFGHKKVFITGVIGFAMSSAAVGLSGTFVGSIGLVIAFRALQGTFGAMLQPSALALLRETFPVEQLNKAIGVWGAVIGASTAAGPIVGGLLVQHISWEACFYVNVPVGVAALVMALLVLKETPSSPAARSFDIPGIILLSGSLFLLIWGLIKGSAYGWGSARTLTFLIGAVVMGAIFVYREQRAKQPLLPLRLFRSASLSAGTVLVVLLMFALFGAMFFMTFYLENVHGLDPVGAGVRPEQPPVRHGQLVAAVAERAGDGGGRRAVRRRRTVDDHDVHPQVPSCLELGGGGVPAAVLGHDEVDPLARHERRLLVDAERATVEDHLCGVQKQPLGRVDGAAHPPSPPVGGRRQRIELAPAGGHEHPAGSTAGDLGGGRRHRGHDCPAVARLRLPAGPFEAQPRYPGPVARLIGVPPHPRRERVGGVDQSRDPLGPKVRGQALGASEPPGTAPTGQRCGVRRPARQRGHDHHVVACRQRLRQAAGLGRPSEQQQARRVGHGRRMG